MKKSLYSIISLIVLSGTLNSQTAPENIDVGIFQPGTYDLTPPGSATFEIAMRPNITFVAPPAGPAASELFFIIGAPNNLVTGNEIFTTTEDNLSNGDMLQVPLAENGVLFGLTHTYFIFAYNGGGINLAPFTLNTWTHAFTLFATNLQAGTGPNDFFIGDISTTLFTEFEVRTQLNVLGFNEFLPNSSMPSLPLDLVSFEANKMNEKSSHLVWTTVNEVNTSTFAVQRSFDKKNWVTIGNVKAAGNSVSIQNYSFVDENVYNGRDAVLNTYYRLHMIDLDGYNKVSPVRSVVFGSIVNTGREFAVYPNPASDGLQVAWDANALDQPTSLEFYDIEGRLVFTRKVSDNTNQEYIDLGLTNLQAGLYLLRIMNGTEPLEHRQIVVQR